MYLKSTLPLVVAMFAVSSCGVISGAVAAAPFNERGPLPAETVPGPYTPTVYDQRWPDPVPLVRVPSSFNQKNEAAQFSPPLPVTPEAGAEDEICEPTASRAFNNESNLGQVCYERGEDGLYHRQPE